jgi:hypothetical protein
MHDPAADQREQHRPYKAARGHPYADVRIATNAMTRRGRKLPAVRIARVARPMGPSGRDKATTAQEIGLIAPCSLAEYSWRSDAKEPHYLSNFSTPRKSINLLRTKSARSETLALGKIATS